MISDREKKLLDEVKRLRFTMDNIGAYIFTKDTKGRYTYANQMVCDLFGTSLDDILGKTDHQFFDLDGSDELQVNDFKVITENIRIEAEERNVMQETGEVRYYWTVKLPTHDEEGNVDGLIGISTDITDRVRAEQSAKDKGELLNTVLENVDSYIYMKDRDRRFLYVNERTAKLFGKPMDQIVGHFDGDVVGMDTSGEFAPLDKHVIDHGTRIAGEETVHTPNGDRIYWSVKLPIKTEGEITGLVGISTDITEVVEEKNRYHELARSDSLTSALSRAFFFEQANSNLQVARRRGAVLGFAIIDLDYFKQINDQYGHSFGDRYLQCIVAILQQNLREGDFLGRIGGDEFAFVINDLSIDDVDKFLERLLAPANALKLTADTGESVNVSISLGLSLSDELSTIDSMFEQADKALYDAKDKGRNCWSIFGRP